MFKQQNRKLKIIMLIDAWFPHFGGGQIHVWELSKKLVEQGNEVVIVTRNLGSWIEKYSGIKVIRLGYFKQFSNIFGRLEYLVLAYLYLLTIEADIIHLHAFSPGLLAPLIRPFKKAKIVFTAHGKGMKIAGLNISGSFLENVVFYKIKYDLFLSVAKKTLKKINNIKNVAIIPNGVNKEKYQVAWRNRKKVEHILYVGRLSHEKGVDLLIEAFQSLGNPKLQLTIVGEGPEMKCLKKISKKRNIIFMSQLTGDKLLRLFKMADLLVLPSRTEGQPVVLFEAWASKLPILVTNVGDNSRYVKDGVNGFITESNVNAIAKKLKIILKNRHLVVITENAYHAVKDYTWDEIAKKTYNQYNKLYD